MIREREGEGHSSGGATQTGVRRLLRAFGGLRVESGFHRRPLEAHHIGGVESWTEGCQHHRTTLLQLL